MVLRLALLFLLAALPARAQTVEVDVELVLAVDVSRSMSPAELAIQRQGYMAALTSDQVLSAIAEGFLGQVAVTYVEWAGSWSQRRVVDWTLIRDRADAEAFVQILREDISGSLRRTSISGAIDHGIAAIEENAFEGLRRVIDVSGDGPNNQGGRVDRARDRAVAKGIVINGLPLMTRDGLAQRWHLDDLDLYYEDCVIGGPGAFVIPVLNWSQFADAVRRKLILELAGPGRMPGLILAAEHAMEPYDCLIGEKIWEQNRDMFTLP